MSRHLLNAFSSEYWEKFLNKFFSLFISVKILWTALFTVLLVLAHISEGTFRDLMLAIIATRGAIEVYAIHSNNKNNKNNQNNKEGTHE